MKKFLVSALGTEVLAAKEIEAADEEAAKEKYRELWMSGMVEALDYEMDITATE